MDGLLGDAGYRPLARHPYQPVLRMLSRVLCRYGGRISLVGLDRRGHALDRLGDDRWGGGEIETHATLAVFAKGDAGAETDAAQFEEDFGGVVTESEFAAIDPGKIRGFRRCVTGGREVLLNNSASKNRFSSIPAIAPSSHGRASLYAVLCAITAICPGWVPMR